MKGKNGTLFREVLYNLKECFLQFPHMEKMERNGFVEEISVLFKTYKCEVATKYTNGNRKHSWIWVWTSGEILGVLMWLWVCRDTGVFNLTRSLLPLLCSVAQLYLTLYYPIDPRVCQVPLSMEFSRQECYNKLPFPSPRDLPNPGIEPGSLVYPALAGRFFLMCYL